MSNTPQVIVAPVDAKGDLIVGTAANKTSNVPVGADQAALVADSTTTPGVAWKQRSRSLGNVTADASAVNTVAETTLATFTLPTSLAAGDLLRFEFIGDLLNSTGAAVTYQFKVKLGATTLHDTGAQSMGSQGTRRNWRAAGTIVIAGTSDERSSLVMTLGSGTFSNAQGVGTNIEGRGTATEDLTAAKNLVLTVTLGTAAANADAILHEAMLRVERA